MESSITELSLLPFHSRTASDLAPAQRFQNRGAEQKYPLLAATSKPQKRGIPLDESILKN